MRFITMHRTNAHWEAGLPPSPELIQKVGALMGELAHTGMILGGEGLRATSTGVRLTFTNGASKLVRGPYGVTEALPAGFAIVRVETIEEATRWGEKLGAILRDVEIDIRPVTEDWDIGMGPKPAGLTTTRYMLLQKQTPEAEARPALSPAQMGAVGKLIGEMSAAGVLLGVEAFAPTAAGARITRKNGRFTIVDGPFTEAKELIAGYAILRCASRQEAVDVALRYAEGVEVDEVDVRLLVERE